VNVGRLNKRVVLQAPVTEQDDAGEEVITSWSEVARIWAAVEPLQGRELFAAQAVNSEITHRVRIRYRAGVNARMRVLYGARELYLKAPPIDPLEKHRELHLMCSEGLVNG